MRNLTRKQKKILDEYPEIQSTHDLPDEVWDALVAENDTEILYQEVDNYLWEHYLDNPNNKT